MVISAVLCLYGVSVKELCFLYFLIPLSSFESRIVVISGFYLQSLNACLVYFRCVGTVALRIIVGSRHLPSVLTSCK